jgi:hypothetical protein
MSAATETDEQAEHALQVQFTHYQEAMSTAYGSLKDFNALGSYGVRGLANLIDSDASMHGYDVEVTSGNNSRDEILTVIDAFIARTKFELPTLAKVLISTKEFNSTIKSDTGWVWGKQVVHYKDSGFTRAMASIQDGFQNVGHFFGHLFKGWGVPEEGSTKEAEMAHADPKHELRTEVLHFCHKYVKDECDAWKIKHIHIIKDDGEALHAADWIGKHCGECSHESA